MYGERVKMALRVNLNREKKIFQLTFQPSLVGAGVDYAKELKDIALRAKDMKESKEVDRCVVLIDGNSGNVLSGVTPSDAITRFATELSGMESFLDIVDGIIIASPDLAASMLVRFCRSLPGMDSLKDKIRVLK